VILPLRTAATTAALRRATHLVVLGGGRSSIGGARSADCSMTLFTHYPEDLGSRGSQKVVHARRFTVGEIGCLPPRNPEYGHCRLMIALMQNSVPYNQE
jgi:hypothetical protein